jgi:hypothetical protein
VTVKASLRVVLLANEITVAESEDPALWQYNLAAITGGRMPPAPPVGDRAGRTTPYAGRAAEQHGDTAHTNGSNGNGVPLAEGLERLAAELGVEVAVLQAACDPTTEPPYMHLDVRAWQEFKQNTAPRGASAVPPIVLAATLLVLWFRIARLGPVTVSQAQAVLGTIDARDKNPARGLKNCNWLQTRDDVIKLNPTRYNMVLAVARAFCTQQQVAGE